MEEPKTVRKVGRPKKIIEDYEAEKEKQREYMRNYMKDYMLHKKDDTEYMEKQRLRIRAYQKERSRNDEELRNKKNEYSRNYYNKMKEMREAFKNTQIAGE